MNANEATTFQPSRQMMLRSQGPVDQLDTTSLSPAGSYVRSRNKNGQSNVNASYNTVSLQIKEKRRGLVMVIVAFLGDDPRDWFAPSLDPDGLPVRPLDWSTTLLQQLRIFVQSLPCDLCSTTVDQRLTVAHQKMLAETSGSYNSSADSVHTQQTNDPSQESNEYYEGYLYMLNKVQGMKEEITEWEEEKEIDEWDIFVLENREKNRPDYELEAHRLRERVAWLEDQLATKRTQASNDQIQAAISELQRVLGFS
jgi:hypothetical protein